MNLARAACALVPDELCCRWLCKCAACPSRLERMLWGAYVRYQKNCFCSPKPMLSTGLGSRRHPDDLTVWANDIESHLTTDLPRCPRVAKVFAKLSPAEQSASARHRSRSAAGPREDHRSGAEAPSAPVLSRRATTRVSFGVDVRRHATLPTDRPLCVTQDAASRLYPPPCNPAGTIWQRWTEGRCSDAAQSRDVSAGPSCPASITLHRSRHPVYRKFRRFLGGRNCLIRTVRLVAESRHTSLRSAPPA